MFPIRRWQRRWQFPRIFIVIFYEETQSSFPILWKRGSILSTICFYTHIFLHLHITANFQVDHKHRLNHFSVWNQLREERSSDRERKREVEQIFWQFRSYRKSVCVNRSTKHTNTDNTTTKLARSAGQWLRKKRRILSTQKCIKVHRRIVRRSTNLWLCGWSAAVSCWLSTGKFIDLLLLLLKPFVDRAVWIRHRRGVKLVWSSFSVVAGASGLFSVELLLLLWTELWFCTTECDILRQVHLFFRIFWCIINQVRRFCFPFFLLFFCEIFFWFLLFWLIFGSKFWF